MHTLFIPPAHPQIYYSGRFDFTDPSQAKHSWPGSSLFIRFEASAVTLHLKTTCSKEDKPLGNFYNIILDGVVIESIASNSHTTSHEILNDLSPGIHTLEVFRRTESYTGYSSFLGFDLSHSTIIPMIHPYIPPARTIEFYGDSLSCGYGNEGIGSAYSSRYSNNYAAYPAITSRILHADYRAIAFSGEGVFRKYTGDTSTSLPKMHDRTFYHSDDSWDFSKWTPDAVVINLGTNDFAIGIPENNTFINAYIDFIKTLALHYPATTFFVVDGPDYYGVDFSQQLDAVVQECIDRDLPLHKISFSTIPDGLTGIGQHPNCAQHSHAADQLSTAIAEIMQWH